MMNNRNILERQSNEEFSIGVAKFLEAKYSSGLINAPSCVLRGCNSPVPSFGFAKVNFDGASDVGITTAIRDTKLLPEKTNLSRITLRDSSITVSDIDHQSISIYLVSDTHSSTENFHISLKEKTGLIPLSPDAKASRMPQNPIVLLEALQDPVPYEFGESRPAKTRKSRKSSSD